MSLNFSMPASSQVQEELLEFCLQMVTDDNFVMSCVITLSILKI
jgi:hypothetical protein